MNNLECEDLDFTGLPQDGESPEQHTSRILNAMTLDEKLLYIGGYKMLAVHALPRHGLPSVWMSDATSGVRSFGASTAFPSGAALAATWNEELVASTASHIAEIARAKGISILLAPGINIARLPTCGRNFEYMGEDPFLAGKMVSSYIRACAERGVICTVKHFAANNSEYERHRASSDVDARTLREIYFPAFETAIKEGKANAVMSSYNPVNGIWTSENRYLLSHLLREEWGFKGFVVSDWNSLYSTTGPVSAGMDLEMPTAKWLKPNLVKTALKSGKITESQIDGMVYNVMHTFFKTGVYHRPVKDPQAREFHPDHETAALEAAREAIVLLKNNDSTLPLLQGKTIAVCGPYAAQTPVMGGGSCHFSRTTGTVNLLEGLRQQVGADTRIVHIPFKNGRISLADRRKLAKTAAVIVTCGFDYLIESEFYDRPWHLPPEQKKLIHQVAELNSRSVVLLISGGGVETSSWSNRVPAIVHSSYLGQSTGMALAEVLLGTVNPSGHLPFSMAEKWENIPSTSQYPKRYWTTSLMRMLFPQGNPKVGKIKHWLYSEGLMVGYRHFDTAGVKPAFPFGHGLSYTDFSIEKIESSRRKISKTDGLKINISIRNTGQRAGSEVIQVYVRDVESFLPRPDKELKGFRKVHLEAGELKKVVMTLNNRAFQYWDPNAGSGGSWVAESGEFQILAGRSSGNIEAELTIKMMPSGQTR